MSKKKVREMRFTHRLTDVWTQKHPHVGWLIAASMEKGIGRAFK